MGHDRRLPSLNALRAFEVTGRRASFQSAADELGVTQGAVAQQVRALEEWLGFRLFLRQQRRLVLTDRGRAYCADIRRAFELTDRERDAVKPQTLGKTRGIAIILDLDEPEVAAMLELAKAKIDDARLRGV